MRYTRFILLIFADIVKKRRSIQHLRIDFHSVCKRANAHDARDVEKMRQTVTAIYAVLFKVAEIVQMPLKLRALPQGVNARHCRSIHG